MESVGDFKCWFANLSELLLFQLEDTTFHSCSHSLVFSSILTHWVRHQALSIPGEKWMGEIPSRLRPELTHRIKCRKRISREKHTLVVEHREIGDVEAQRERRSYTDPRTTRRSQRSTEGKILQNIGRKIDESSLHQFPDNQTLQGIFMNSCMWATRCTSVKTKTISNATSRIWKCRRFRRSSKRCKHRSATSNSVTMKSTEFPNKVIEQMDIGDIIRCWITELPIHSNSGIRFNVLAQNVLIILMRQELEKEIASENSFQCPKYIDHSTTSQVNQMNSRGKFTCRQRRSKSSTALRIS